MTKCLFLMLALSLPSQANGHSSTHEAATVIGHIIASEGLWCDSTSYACATPNAKNVVGRMYPVRIGARFVRMGAITGHEWLRIRSYITGSEVRFECSVAVDCKDVLDLQRLYPPEGAPDPNGVLAAFLQALRRIAATEPVVYERYRQGLLRAENSTESLHDGTALLDAHGLNVDQVLLTLAAGSYELELCPIDKDADVHCSTEPHPSKFAWNPTRPRRWLLPKLRPGLYRLYICQEASQGFVRTDSYASVLAVGPAAYRQLNREFQDVVAVTRSWNDADPTVTAILRMYLQDMAFRSHLKPLGATPSPFSSKGSAG